MNTCFLKQYGNLDGSVTTLMRLQLEHLHLPEEKFYPDKLFFFVLIGIFSSQVSFIPQTPRSSCLRFLGARVICIPSKAQEIIVPLIFATNKMNLNQLP